MGDFNNTNCIVLMGHNPRRHSWTPIYNYIRSAQKRGAKLIVCDPRKSSSAERADIWLPLKAGSDGGMMFGWLKVIFDEGLYDKDFVANWTIGFEELRKRDDLLLNLQTSRQRSNTAAVFQPETVKAQSVLYRAHSP